MPGLFDDLVPADATPRAGRFDDLVPQAPKTGFIEGVKQTGRELGESVRRGGQYLRGLGLSFNIQEAQNLDDLISRAEAAGDQESVAALRAEKETRLQNVGATAAGIAKSDAESTFKSRPVVEEIGRAQSVGEVGRALAKDPVGAVVGFTAESAAQMAPALVAGIFGGPAAGIATMGATSAAAELGSTILDYAQEKGVNTKDPSALTAFYSNPANLEAATNKGGTRAVIIGSLDALTGGIASKTLAPAAVKGTLKRQAINIPAQMGVQMTGGGGGEALGQLATEGKITSVGAIAGEVLGELGGAPAEVAAFSNEVRKARARKPIEAEIKDVLDAPDLDSAIEAADKLARADALDAANRELDAATDAYLAGAAPAARPTATDIDRQAALTEQSIVAGTAFERQSAAEQAAVARGAPAPGPAAEFVDLTPMNPLQARQRLAVLRDEIARAGGDALELQIASHPAQPGALAIRRVPLPRLDLGTNVPEMGTDEAQQRIESAALAGEVSRRRNTPEEQGRQALITRALQAIEQRGGVASPAEAQVLREANLGRPYDRVDPALAAPLREEERLTQATGLAVDRGPARETVAAPAPAPDLQAERLAAQERANERSLAAFAEGAPARAQARAVGEKALQEASQRAPLPPPAPQVIEALRVAPARRGADLKARVDLARARYSAEEMTALELAANAPATMTPEQKLVVKRLSEVKASPQRALAQLGLREVDPATLPAAGSRVRQGQVVLEGITKESYGTVSRLGKLFGKRVVLFDDQAGGRDGFFDPKDPDTIYLNRQASRPHLVVFGHELLHSLKKDSPQIYAQLESAIRGQLKDKAVETFQEDYGQVEGATEEIVADIVGNRMAEEQFWADVFGKMDAPAAKRLAMAVVSAVQKAKAVVARMTGFKTDELIKDLDAVREAAVSAMRKYAGSRFRAAQALQREEQAAPTAPEATKGAPTAPNATVGAAGAPRAAPNTPTVQRGADEQPRAADGTFKSWNEEDELAAAEAQQKFSRTRNNASGESAASLEAQGRLRQEAALDRQRVLVERDGTVRPLIGVNAVDQRARAGQVILQKNIGKNTWTVIEQGPDVTPGMVARAIYNAGRVKESRARQTARPSYGEPREGAISVVGVHYSQQPRTELDSSRAGTGLKGADLARIERDAGEKQRIYFYVDKGRGVTPESGVGGYAHEVQLNNLYDAEADPLFLAEDNPGATAFETAVTKAGFDGYYRDSFRTDVGAAVLLGRHTVPVAQIGQGPRKASGETPARAKAPERTGWRKTLADFRASKKLPSGALAGERWPGTIKRLEPAIYDNMLPSGVFQAIMDRDAMYKDEVASEYRVRASKARKEPKTRDEALARLAGIERYLTEEEKAELSDRAANTMVKLFDQLPPVDQFAAAAWAGRAKRGWYKESARAIARVFGPDAPRFTALLAATSPQQSVQTNLENALSIWKNWLAAGRPTTRRAIMGVMAKSVQGDKGKDSVLDAWRNNTLRALTSPDPTDIVLSGPKVDSFMRNLTGEVEEVTNDAWMANFAYIDQALLGGTGRLFNGEKLGRKSAGYLAMSARVRAAAERLTELTGETWTPSEVQETVWSWAKTLYEAQNDERGTARDILYNEELTDDMIRATPDFRGLFHDAKYAAILRDAGYGEQLGALDSPPAAGEGDRDVVEAGPFDSGTESRLLNEAAARLETLKEKGKPGGDAVLESFTDENLPELLGRKNWAILTASDPGAKKQSKAKNDAANARLEADLQAAGYEYMVGDGKYGDLQDVFVVVGIKAKDALALGQKYGQESILTRAGLVYSDGRPNTKPTGKVVVYDTPPKDFYTYIPDYDVYFQVELDFFTEDGVAAVKESRARPAEVEQLVELRKQESVLRSLRKCLLS